MNTTLPTFYIMHERPSLFSGLKRSSTVQISPPEVQMAISKWVVLPTSVTQRGRQPRSSDRELGVSRRCCEATWRASGLAITAFQKWDRHVGTGA